MLSRLIGSPLQCSINSPRAAAATSCVSEVGWVSVTWRLKPSERSPSVSTAATETTEPIKRCLLVR